MPRPTEPGGGGPPAPSANVKTGANPRGVAISVPKAPTTRATVAARLPKAITTGANPRGVSIAAPPRQTINDVNAKLAAPKRAPKAPVLTARGGLAIGAVRPQGFLGSAGNIAGRLVSDVVNLPKSTLEGVTQVGTAGLHDVEHGNALKDFVDPFGVGYGKALLGGGNTELQSTVHAGLNSDPLVQLATLHPARAAALASAHPLSAILDATGAAGAIGRGLGAVARTGAVGSRLADAAALNRGVLEAAPGIPGTAEARTASPNIFVSAIQHGLDNNPELRAKLQDKFGKTMFNRLGVTGPENTLKKQAAMLYGPEKSRVAREVQQTAKDLKAAKPAGKVERDATPYIAAFGGGRDTLEHLREHYLDARASGTLRPSTLKQTDQHIANLTAALTKDDQGKLDWASINKAADAYRQRQGGLEAQKVALGLNEDPELSRALEKQYARVRMPGTDFLKPGDAATDPQWVAEKRAAAATLREETSNLKRAEKIVAERAGAYKGASRVLADAQRRLPLHPATDSFANHLLDARNVLESIKPHDAAYDQNLLAALKDRVDTAQKEFDLVKAHPRKIQGLVTEDPAARPILSGKHQGRQLRPLSSDEIRAHMAATDSTPSYVRMNNPERERPGTVPLLRSDISAPSSSTGKEFTGQSALVGDWLPGWKALARSQQTDVRAVGQARLEQAFLHRFGLKDVDQTDFYDKHFTPHNWEQAAAEYENRTGVPVEPLIDRAAGHDKVVLVPKAAKKELEGQLKLENPKGAAKAALNVNRAFRNTVLPMSPKLPIMHTVENVTRANLGGALGFPFNPTDLARARAALSRMDEINPAAAARLRDLATPGGMGGGAAKLDEEDLGRLGTQHSGAYNAVTAPAHVWNQAAHGIIAFQRAIERHAQAAALGVHMRQSLQSWGHSWAEANTSVAKLADEVARGYADPAVAEDAARFVHRTMGQYNNFTARQRWFISRVAPFSPWYANAARLVWHELPVGHPLKTVLMQDVAAANQPSWNASHSGLPADMQTFASLGPGHYLDVGRFTPIGIEKNPLEEGVPLMFPAYSSAALALFGKDPFGNDMYGPNTPYGKPGVAPLSMGAGLHAIDALLEGTAGPASSIARVIEGKGGTLYSDSMPLFGHAEIKPNSQHAGKGVMAGVNKVFNPFAGVYYGHGGRSGALPAAPSNALKGNATTLKGGATTLKGNAITLKGPG